MPESAQHIGYLKEDSDEYSSLSSFKRISAHENRE